MGKDCSVEPVINLKMSLNENTETFEVGDNGEKWKQEHLNGANFSDQNELFHSFVLISVNVLILCEMWHKST